MPVSVIFVQVTVVNVFVIYQFLADTLFNVT